MKMLNPRLFVVASMLALAGCAAEYTEAEAPKTVTLDNATRVVSVRFAHASSRLVGADAARLRTLAANGGILPSDRIAVSAAGSPALAAARVQAVANVLLGYNIIATQRPPVAMWPDQALIQSERYLVTLPPCPNWSKRAAHDFTNTVDSNFGCATAVNLGLSVAYPADLAEGPPVEPALGVPAAAAVQRYEADKVTLPSAATVGPIVAPSTSPTGSGATGAGTAGSTP